ncbi:hypothetical protein MTP03_19000 [Tsukamurella sp. PLM1]|nr:hypothetical protein MTP03_19000 [Tsukamurella sp. PLM1]
MVPADLHQVLVPGLAEDLHRVLGGGVQLVVTGHPDHCREARDDGREHLVELVRALAQVAGQDQPIRARRAPDPIDDALVPAVPHVQVTDRIEVRHPSTLPGRPSGTRERNTDRARRIGGT